MSLTYALLSAQSGSTEYLFQFIIPKVKNIFQSWRYNETLHQIPQHSETHGGVISGRLIGSEKNCQAVPIETGKNWVRFTRYNLIQHPSSSIGTRPLLQNVI